MTQVDKIWTLITFTAFVIVAVLGSFSNNPFDLWFSGFATCYALNIIEEANRKLRGKE